MEKQVDHLIEEYESQLNEDKPQDATRTLLDYLLVLYMLKYGTSAGRHKHRMLCARCRNKFRLKHGCSPVRY